MGVERLYNSVEFDEAVPVEFKIGRSYRGDVVGKATSGRRGLWALMSWGPEKMLIRSSKESLHPAEWTPASGEQERHNVDGNNNGVRILQFLFGLQLPLTRKPWTTFSNHCNKVRGKYFSKKSSCVFIIASVVHCVGMYPAYICIFRHESVDDNTTFS